MKNGYVLVDTAKLLATNDIRTMDDDSNHTAEGTTSASRRHRLTLPLIVEHTNAEYYKKHPRRIMYAFKCMRCADALQMCVESRLDRCPSTARARAKETHAYVPPLPASVMSTKCRRILYIILTSVRQRSV